MTAMDWIITYDISSDPHRTAVGHILGRHGIRTLYTVHQIAADTAILDGIIEQIRPHVASGDHLLALPVCADCRQARIGTTIETVPAHGWISQ
jgi:CRISPR/Cas system-associated endoribonuclease Cas2